MAKSKRSHVGHFPKFEEKESVRTSATSILRRRNPTNEFTASKHPAMIWDYSIQRKVWPNGNPRALIEASSQTGHKYDTINKSGRPFALGNMDIGGAPDTKGDPLHVKAPPKRMLK